ncbi:MAG: sugar ABC transporter substrate-binding protein [Firmicutes bacterium]|nr:sugar ABC transporter substrate-binding protein [Bacillota bacterium]
MKRWFQIISVVFLIIALMTPALFAASNIKLTFCYWGSPAEDKVLKEAFKDFEAAHPGITVEPMYIPGDITGTEYAAKIKALSQAGALPDLGYFRPDHFGGWAANGLFLDLTPYVKKEKLRDAFLPQVWLEVKGKIYGAYTAAECQVLFYNKDVLEKAGVPLPPTDYRKGWSWDQFVDYCKKITEDKNGKHPGESGFDPNKIVKYGVSYQLWHAMLLPSLWSNNGEFITPDGRQFKLDSKESVEVLQKLADLINKDHVFAYTNPSSTSGAGLPAPPVMLANGQLGFYVTGQWELLDLAQMKFPLGVGALPIWKKPAQMYISGASVVFKSTKHPKEAWELHKWMMTPDKTLNLYTSGLWMPTKASWYKDPADLKKWLDNPVHPAGFKEAVVDSMQVARVHFEVKVKNFPQIWGEAVAPELDQVWIGQKTAAEAMKAAKERVMRLKLLQGNY